MKPVYIEVISECLDKHNIIYFIDKGMIKVLKSSIINELKEEENLAYEDFLHMICGETKTGLRLYYAIKSDLFLWVDAF